jgi:hypothetical protein
MGFPEIQIREALSEYVFGRRIGLIVKATSSSLAGEQATASPSSFEPI